MTSRFYHYKKHYHDLSEFLSYLHVDTLTPEAREQLSIMVHRQIDMLRDLAKTDEALSVPDYFDLLEKGREISDEYFGNDEPDFY